jgi:dTMP kinase
MINKLALAWPKENKLSVFIAIEGIDGSGKSTQARRLVDYFNSIGKKAIFTREPGGTPLAEELRGMILRDNGISDPITELLMLNAARRDHIENFIKPKLTEGYIVVCDRFIGSTYAYQGELKHLRWDIIKQAHILSTQDFYPDICLVFDIDPNLATQRVIERSGDSTFYDKLTMMEKVQLRNAFLMLSNLLPPSTRTHVIKADRGEDEVYNELITYIAA